MTRAELMRHALPSPYYLVVVIVIIKICFD